MALETVSSSLPILVLTSDIVFPASQLTISVPRSLAPFLSRIVKNEEGKPALVAAVPAVNSSPLLQLQDAQPCEWGCSARIVRFVRATPLSPNSCIVTLAGVTRVQLESPLPSSSSLVKMPQHPMHYDVATDKAGAVDEHAAEAFRNTAIRLVDRLDAEGRNKGGRAGLDWRRMRSVIEDAEPDRVPWVADILMAVVTSIPWQDRLQMLSTSSPSARVRLATSLFSKQASIVEVSQKINTAVDESLSKQQKEFYLRQQMQAIQRELANLNRTSKAAKGSSKGAIEGVKSSDDLNSGQGEASNEFDEEGDEAEYLADIRAKIEAMMPGSEERKMGVKEYRRLKRIPAGSVEQGVIRNYLDWLTQLPWPNTQSRLMDQSLEVMKDPAFLRKAREQLDADHFGLDTIKRRLIEHLAVIRLKALNQINADAKAVDNTGTQVDHSLAATIPVPPAGSSEDGVVSNPTPQDGLGQPKPVQKRQPIRTKGPILLLVGPPGCGKTSIASSLARALGRPFHRISLGGVRDEAEIRGHRRTYVASGPGAIVTAMSKVQRPDPVILLDEIDKVGHASYQGDPASALLEVLDPEQNIAFKDHYINVPLDLGQVIFIATANTLDTISEPLLDRCEVIRLSGYTYDEKVHIARKFLLPKQLEASGLPAERLTITDDAYLHIASYYTREAGVRSLERALGSIARWKAVEWSNAGDASPEKEKEKEKYNPVVDVDDLEDILGVPRWDSKEDEREERRGLVYGLVVSGHGEGGVLPVESVMTGGTGKLRLTGSLGDVIRESGEIALSWVKANAYALGITSSPSDDPLKHPHPIDIHLHLPSGAVKKDGPSAGVAYVCAFISLLTGLTVPKYIAMTGETTLRGRITAVGGIKEKVLGAHRAGIRKVILPRSNRKDVEHDVPPEVIKQMEFVYATRVEDALDAAFGPGAFHAGARMTMQVESRL